VSGTSPVNYEFTAQNVSISLNKSERKYLQQDRPITPSWVQRLLVEESFFLSRGYAYLYPDTYNILEEFLANTNSMYSRFETFEIKSISNHKMICSYQLLFWKEFSGISWNISIIRDIRLRNAHYYKFIRNECVIFSGSSHPQIYYYRPNYNLVENEISDFMSWRAVYVRHATEDIHGNILVSEDNIFGIPIGTSLGSRYKSLMPSHPENRIFRLRGRVRRNFSEETLEAYPFLPVGRGFNNIHTYNNDYKEISRFRTGSPEYYRNLGDILMLSVRKGNKN